MEKLWNRNYNLVMATNSLVYIAFFILTPLLPLYLSERFAAGKSMIGVVLSGYTIAALLTRPFSGYIVDSFSRKKVFILCLAFFSVFFLGYVGAGTILMFALVRVFHGIPFGAVTVSNSTVAIDVLPSSRRNEGIGLYGLSGNIGMAIAPSLGIYLHNLANSYAILFWIAFVCSLLSVALSFFVKIPEKEIVKNKRKLSLDRFFLTKSWLMAINIALFGLCFGTLSNYLAIYSKQELGITNGTGTYFMILAIGLILSRFQGAKSLRKGKLTENAAKGMLLSLCGYVVFAAFNSLPFYYLSAILIGLGNGHMYPAFLNMFINVARHDERGTANSSILTSWDFGVGIGILIGGIISEYSGFSTAFWTIAIINAVGVILFFTCTRSFFLSRRKVD